MANPFEDPIINPLGDQGQFAGSYGDVGTAGAGLIGLMSNVFKTITIVGGLFMVINLVVAGFMYVSGGHDPKQTAAAWQKIYMSLIGLVLMVGAYAIAGVIGWILFGNPAAILNPTIYGPGVIE